MRFVRNWIRNQSASIMPVMMISLTAIVGVAGAAIAISMDGRSAHNLQKTADVAALGGATAFLQTPSPKLEDRKKAAEDQANALAQANAEYALTELGVGAFSEDAYGQKLKLEVELAFKPVNPAAKLAGRSGTIEIKRRAVAEATWGFPLCVLTLAEDGPGVSVNHRTTLSAEKCLIWSNSTARDAMQFTGGVATAKYFCAAGEADIAGAAIVKPKPTEKCQALPDPLAGYDIVQTSVCDHVKYRVQRNKTVRLKPGTYCGGLDILSDKVEFEPGIYHILGGLLRFHTKGALKAEGVTFLLDGDLSGFDIKSDSSVTLLAPASGPTAGVAIAQRPSLVPSPLDNLNVPDKAIAPGAAILGAKITGVLNAQGVIYMPSFDLTLSKSGGGETTSPYLQLVANRLIMDGSAALKVDFDESATSLPIVIQPERYARLVE